MIHVLQPVATMTAKTHPQKKGVWVNLFRCRLEMAVSTSGIIEHTIMRLSQARFLGSTLKPLIIAKIAIPEKKCALSSIADTQSICSAKGV